MDTTQLLYQIVRNILTRDLMVAMQRTLQVVSALQLVSALPYIISYELDSL